MILDIHCQPPLQSTHIHARILTTKGRENEVQSLKSQHYSLISRIPGNLGASSGVGGCGSAWLETDCGRVAHGLSLVQACSRAVGNHCYVSSRAPGYVNFPEGKLGCYQVASPSPTFAHVNPCVYINYVAPSPM